MAFAELTWIRFPAFGVDFINHVDKGVRTWVAGGDPYAERHLLYSYPPIVLRLFIWAKLTAPEVSVRIWICLAAVCAAVGAIAAVRTRRELGLEEFGYEECPANLAVAYILFSTPVLFALERANYDLLIVPLVVGAVLFIQRNSKTADVIAALLLAVAIWSKLYPGLLILGVLALRRWRVATWLMVFCTLIALSDPPELMRFLENNKLVVDTAWALARALPDTLHPWNHPLPLAWPALWSGTPLARVPGQLGTALLLGSLLIWVSWHMYQSSDRDRLALPYFFWVVALASFVPPVANDYNLTPLPLAVLAIWNREDRWFVHVALAALLLWWQPFHFPLPATGTSPLGGGRIILFIKIAGLIAVAIAIVGRASKASRETGSGLGGNSLQNLRKRFIDDTWVGRTLGKPQDKVLLESKVVSNTEESAKGDSPTALGKIDFHGMQLVPFDNSQKMGLREPMDIHPASRWHLSKFAERHGGFFPTGNNIAREISFFDELDLVRRDMLVLLMRNIVQRDVKGDFAELGVFRGLTAKLIHHYVPERPLHLFDTFTGFDNRDLQAEPIGTDVEDARKWFRDTNVAGVTAFIAPINTNVHIYPGFFPESVPTELNQKRFAFVHLDADLYAPIQAGLAFFYSRLSSGGTLVVHDYNAWFGARQAVDEFFLDKTEVPLPMPDRSGSVVIVKQ